MSFFAAENYLRLLARSTPLRPDVSPYATMRSTLEAGSKPSGVLAHATRALLNKTTEVGRCIEIAINCRILVDQD